MSRIVKISESDYRVKVQSGGVITLDTGSDIGTVVVTGDLVVQGETTTINTTNMSIEDNIIVLNKGEQSPSGISINPDGTNASGLRIDRGQTYRESIGDLTPEPYDALMIFDENVHHYNPVTSADTSGTFVFKLASNERSGVQINSVVSSGTTDLVFDMRNTNNMLKVVNSIDYGSRVVDDNHIPNKKYVDDYVYAVGGYAVTDQIFNPVSATPGNEDTKVIANPASIQFLVRSAGSLNQRAIINSTGLSVDEINTYQHVITSNGPNPLILTATNTHVEVAGVLNLDDQAPTPTISAGKSRIYSKELSGPGRSGLYITNTSMTDIEIWNPNTTSYETGHDELIIKNRALLFSMLF